MPLQFHFATAVDIERYENGVAVDVIGALRDKRRELQENSRVLEWLQEQSVVCYVLREYGRILSFALLTDFPDPTCGSSHRKLLSYIYTVESQRARGLASRLLLRVKEQEGAVSAVCWNDISERMFFKAGFIIHDIASGHAVYRCP